MHNSSKGFPNLSQTTEDGSSMFFRVMVTGVKSAWTGDVKHSGRQIKLSGIM